MEKISIQNDEAVLEVTVPQPDKVTRISEKELRRQLTVLDKSINDITAQRDRVQAMLDSITTSPEFQTLQANQINNV